MLSHICSTGFDASTPAFLETYLPIAAPETAMSSTINITIIHVIIFPATGGIFSSKKLAAGYRSFTHAIAAIPQYTQKRRFTLPLILYGR